MKKILLVVVVFLLVFAVVGVFALRRQPTGSVVSQPTPMPELTLLSPPLFPSPVAPQPTYVVPTVAVSFPQALPEYRLAPVPAEDVARSFAMALGFSGAPKELGTSSGTVFVWNEGGGSLSVGGNPLEVSYASGKTAAGTVLAPPATLRAAAEALVLRLGLAAGSYEILPLPPRSFAASGFDLVETEAPGEATVVEVGYRYALASRPVFGRRPNEPGIAVRFNAAGEVMSLAATALPPAKESGKSVAVAAAEDVSARLSSGGGVLVYLFADADKNNFTAPQYAVPAVSVHSVSLGYYYSPGLVSLSPVFLAEGTGKDGETGKDVRFMTLVSALR